MKSHRISRRDFVVGLAAAGLTAGLAACAPSAPPAPAEPSPEQPKPTEAPAEAPAATEVPAGTGVDNHDVFRPLMPADQALTLGFWDSCTSERTNVIYDRYIKLFNNFYPNVTIDRQHAQSKENYLASVAAGTPPDIWHGGWDPEMFGNYANNGVIIALDDYIKEVEFPLDRFLPGAMENATMDGKVWGLPEGFAIFTLWYHPPQWEEIGHPDAPKDTDELIDMVYKLTKRDDQGNITRLGMQLPNWWWVDFGWMGAFGGVVWDKQAQQPTPDSPGVINSLNALQDIVKTYGVDQMDAWVASIGSQQGAQMPYMTGDLAMYIDGNYADQYPAELAPDWVFGKEYGSIALPPAPSGKLGGDPYVALWGYPLAISAASKNPRWAFEMIRFIQSREYIVPMNVESRDLPAVKSFIEDKRFTNGSAQLTRAVMAGPLPTVAVLPMHPVASEYASKLSTAVEEIIHLKTAPEDSLAALKAEIQNSMNQG